MQFPAQPSGRSGRAFRRDLRRNIMERLRPLVVVEIPADLNLDSDAVAVLVHCAQIAVAHDAELALVASEPRHRVLLALTRVSSVIRVFPSVIEALGELERCPNTSLKPVQSISRGHRALWQRKDM